MAESGGAELTSGEELAFLADLPDDEAGADESARRAAAEAAFDALPDEELGDYAELLVTDKTGGADKSPPGH